MQIQLFIDFSLTYTFKNEIIILNMHTVDLQLGDADGQPGFVL